jgi:hypothetical protein
VVEDVTKYERVAPITHALGDDTADGEKINIVHALGMVVPLLKTVEIDPSADCIPIHPVAVEVDVV